MQSPDVPRFDGGQYRDANGKIYLSIQPFLTKNRLIREPMDNHTQGEAVINL